MKHNNVVPNQHFKKHWAGMVRTWFNQPARKLRRRNGTYSSRLAVKSSLSVTGRAGDGRSTPGGAPVIISGLICTWKCLIIECLMSTDPLFELCIGIKSFLADPS